jgi:hypothetical protein
MQRKWESAVYTGNKRLDPCDALILQAKHMVLVFRKVLGN